MKYTIYLDFQGTVIETGIERCNFGCFEVLKKLQDAGHTIILNTSYADEDKAKLAKALKYVNEDSWMHFKLRNSEMELSPITSTTTKYGPDRWDWEKHNREKVIYIDDYSYGIPLKKSGFTTFNRVDFEKLDIEFQEKGLY